MSRARLADIARHLALLVSPTALTIAACGLGAASAAALAGAQPAATIASGASFIAPGASIAWGGLMEYPNTYGRVGVASVGQPFDTKDNPFFKPGPNGRACVTCHQPANAMSLSLDTIRARWAVTGGKDPMFDAIDGSNCPNLPQDQAASHSLLLSRGVFRIRMPWPPRKADGTAIDPEFKIEVASDPTGCNTSPVYGLNSPNPTISVYRRPRMVANLRYVDTPKYTLNYKTMMPLERDPETGIRSSMSLMADGRALSLKAQMEDAMRSHLGLTGPLPQATIDKILDFEQRIYVAADYSNEGGSLIEPGHPKALGVQAMVEGQDHVNGNDFDNGVFFFFDQWRPGGANEGATQTERDFRASVARGYDIFFRRPFWITDTVGINNIRLGNPYKQTCGFCHNTQLTGHDDVPGWMDLGTVNFPHAPPAADLPLFKITCKPSSDNPHPYLGDVIYSNDPGRALVSGRCIDVGGLVMQDFRGIAARAPYFASGSAKTLRDVVDFYDRRYNIGFSEQEKTDLVNFLSVL